MRKIQKVTLWLAPGLFFFLVNFPPSTEVIPFSSWKCFAATVWIAIWWIAEPIPIAVTSLLPILLLPAIGIVSPSKIASAYGDPILFLFLGGFLIAIAMEKWELHRQIAIRILSRLGSDPRRILMGFILTTSLLSLWISNTATAMMMIPIALAVSDSIDSTSKSEFRKKLVLGIAYSASIGGLGTIIGTPPNAVFVAVSKEILAVEIDFLDWMKIGIPIVLVLLPLLYWTLVIGMDKKGKTDSKIQWSIRSLSFEQRAVFFVFLSAAFLWIFRGILLKPYLPWLTDTMIAIGCGISLFAIPSKQEAKILIAEDLRKVPWGIILLFGGGLALAASFQESGLSEWIASQMSSLKGMPLLLSMLIVALIVNFLTEVTSNTATATLFLPVLAAVSQGLGFPPLYLMIPATFAASCAFMLPVATPPNAIAFGSGHLKIRDMVRNGFILNLASSGIIAVLVYFLLPIVWQP